MKIKTIMIVAMVCGSTCSKAEEEIEWFADVDVTGSHDNNVGKAQKRRDIAEEYIGSANISAGMNWEIALKQALAAKVIVEAETHETVKGLGYTAYGGELNYRWQFALGFGAPFYSFTVRGFERSTDFEQRDLSQTTMQLQMSKRLSDHLTWTIGVEHREEESDGTVFDTKQARLFNNFDYLIDDDWLMYFTLSYIDGDATSTAQRVYCNGLTADIYPLRAAATEVEADLAFEDAFCGEWLAYKLDAKSGTLVGGLNRTLDHSSSLDLSVLYVDTSATDDDVEDIDYQRTVVRVSYLVRF